MPLRSSQRVTHSGWLPTRRGVLGDAGARNLFQSVLVHHEIFLEFAFVVVGIADVIAKVVVNPAAMAANFVSARDQ